MPRCTDSTVARSLLADWDAAAPRFSAVIARDYRRVIEATGPRVAAGEDVDAAVMAAAKG